jgi:sulfate permease, SulP family
MNQKITLNQKTLVSRMASNWKSGLTVALVSIPMSVSLAVASGTTPTVGIITAIWAGLIASALGGSNFNIVGPAGALSGILAGFSLTHGADLLPMLAILTGIFVLVSYALRLERYLAYIPASTVHGFTLGVGLVLALGQLGTAFGLPTLPQHSEFISNVTEAIRHLGELNIASTIVFFSFLIAMFVLLKLIKKVPPAIILTPIGILIGYLSHIDKLPFALVTLGDKFPTIKAALFVSPSFSFSSDIVVTALTVTAVAILETMLCGKVADGMTGTKYNRRKEMFALSAANLGSGFAGGLPATAVLARTALNAKSGATHKTSQGLNSVFIVIISYLLLSYFKFIPMPVIAAILVFTSIRMIEQHHFARMFKYDKVSFVISLLVAFATVYWDPMVGILLGTAVSLLFFVEKLSKGQFDLIANDVSKQKIVDRIHGTELKELPPHCDTLVYSIKGQLAYINAQAHIARFENNTDGQHKNIVLRLRELYFVDLDGVDAFDELVEVIEKSGKKVFVTGINPLIEKSLKRSKVYARLLGNNKVFVRTSEALTALGFKQ